MIVWEPIYTAAHLYMYHLSNSFSCCFFLDSRSTILFLGPLNQEKISESSLRAWVSNYVRSWNNGNVITHPYSNFNQCLNDILLRKEDPWLIKPSPTLTSMETIKAFVAKIKNSMFMAPAPVGSIHVYRGVIYLHNPHFCDNSGVSKQFDVHLKSIH